MLRVAFTVAFAISVYLEGAHSASANNGRAPVDLELVIAVDASGSVSDNEFALQIGGIAAAFREPDIHEAIASGPQQRIAVALMIWADARARQAISPWIMIDGPDAAFAFADLVEAQAERRQIFRGRSGTGIGAAIGQGVRELRTNKFDGTRLAIDVSGDGRETPLMFGEGMALTEAHKRAARLEVVVNGLAILSDDPNLNVYYRARVAMGPGSFVISAADYDDFARAMRLKLVREIRQLIGKAPGPPLQRSRSTSNRFVRPVLRASHQSAKGATALMTSVQIGSPAPR